MFGVRYRPLWVAVALLAGCGGDDTGSDVVPGGDATAPETQEVSTDAGGDSAPAEVDPGPGLGLGFGAACADNRDCASGYCVPSAGGLVCSRGCTPSCPEGWVCGRILDAGVDAARVCLSRASSLCQPCVADADCRDPASGGAEGAACLSYGDAGRFCGLPCSPDAPCPEGYGCEAEARAEGSSEGQCRRLDDLCSCNEIGRSLGMFTTCSVAAPLGTCGGTRGCTDTGLEACSAAPATDETCNGVDDDCDGTIDDGLPLGAACAVTNDLGTCPGVEVCSGGAVRCVGTPAEAERCDGLDQDCDGDRDEGFPDLDGDGEADCVDSDTDGDGTFDAEDCAPRDPARGRAATEVCNGVDDDCDGALDEPGARGCTGFYPDVDRDGFGSDAAPARCLCAADPATFHDATAAGDCDDLSSPINPRGTEACNGADDDCDRAVDEGVEAPCGGCVALCLLETGPSAPRSFTLGPHATGLSLDPLGHLQLGPGQTVGSYRQVLAGWTLGVTRWQALFLGVSTPSGTSVRARWRTAASQAELSLTPWGPWSASLPPANSPLWLDVDGAHLEIEVELRSATLTATPALSQLGLLTSRNP
jgi:hypothetical protein